jgi:cytolysin-activating lysine-acyltransferase
MHIEGLDYIAPEQSDPSWNEAQVFGSAVWLWMHSKAHRDDPLHALNSLLLPAIRHRQFVLASENGRPVAYISWANFCEEAERRYLAQPAICMKDADWVSGERMWILDWIAPFGHTAQLTRALRHKLLLNRHARTLYHRAERGLHIKTFKGIGIRHEEARAWFAAHPAATPDNTNT